MAFLAREVGSPDLPRSQEGASVKCRITLDLFNWLEADFWVRCLPCLIQLLTDIWDSQPRACRQCVAGRRR